MVSLRNFCTEDSAILQRQNRYQRSLDAIQDMIAEWNTKLFHHRYYEMFAVINENEIVGTLSLYEHSRNVVSIRPEIFTEYRRQGFAFQAMKAAVMTAKTKGYKIVFQQIRTDNIASLKLHTKLDFETDHYVYKNRHGNDVLIFFNRFGRIILRA